MSKDRTPSDELVTKFIKQGFGQGELDRYKPWQYVRDVPSTGDSSQLTSAITGRVHHYLSNLELRGHLRAEHCKLTVDVREQYALLPRDETVMIAKCLGVRHPQIPRTDTLSVMSTDIVVTQLLNRGVLNVARSFKPKKNLTKRAKEKLLIEKLRWNRRGVPWQLFTEDDLRTPYDDNLSFFSPTLRTPDWKSCGVEVAAFAHTFESQCRRGLTYIEALEAASQHHAVDSRLGHRLVGASVYDHASRIDLNALSLTHTTQVVLQ